MVKLAAYVVVVCGLSSSTNAAWSVKSEGPDVFGDTTVTAINSTGLNNGLILKCNQDNLLEVAYLERASNPSDIMRQPAIFAIQVDNNAPLTSDGHIQEWNDKFVAVVLEGKSPELVGMIRSIGAARQKINVGIKIGSQRESTTFDAAKAADVTTIFVKNCKL